MNILKFRKKTNFLKLTKSMNIIKSSRGGLEVEHVDSNVFSLLQWIESRLGRWLRKLVLNKKKWSMLVDCMDSSWIKRNDLCRWVSKGVLWLYVGQRSWSSTWKLPSEAQQRIVISKIYVPVNWNIDHRRWSKRRRTNIKNEWT